MLALKPRLPRLSKCIHVVGCHTLALLNLYDFATDADLHRRGLMLLELALPRLLGGAGGEARRARRGHHQVAQRRGASVAETV